jgi:hypothetical protein
VLPRTTSVPGEAEANAAGEPASPLVCSRCSSHTPQAAAISWTGRVTVVSPGPPREAGLVAEADDREPARYGHAVLVRCGGTPTVIWTVPVTMAACGDPTAARAKRSPARGQAGSKGATSCRKRPGFAPVEPAVSTSGSAHRAPDVARAQDRHREAIRALAAAYAELTRSLRMAASKASRASAARRRVSSAASSSSARPCAWPAQRLMTSASPPFRACARSGEVRW